MRYLKEVIIDEIIIKKSRFITIITPVASETDFLTILNQIKKDYPKATHYCTAYLLGDGAQYAGSNDDGEPAGTAGMPMLEALKQAGVTNAFAVVVRYYGGVQLGASGLTRAYANCVTNALKLGKYFTKVPAVKYLLNFPYDKVNDTEFLLSKEVILDKLYEENVTYTVAITNQEEFEKIKHNFTEIKKLEDMLLAKDLK